MERPIAVIFHRYGPYHCARMRAFAARGPAVAIEVVRKDTTYQWDLVDYSQDFRRVTLFPELMADEPRVGDLRRRLYRCLETEKPRAVAIPGWSTPYAFLALWWCLKTSTPAVLMSESTVLDRRRTFLVRRLSEGCSACTGRPWWGGDARPKYVNLLGFPELAVVPGYAVVDNAHFGRLQVGGEAGPIRGNPSWSVAASFGRRTFHACLKAMPDTARRPQCRLGSRGGVIGQGSGSDKNAEG